MRRLLFVFLGVMAVSACTHSAVQPNLAGTEWLAESIDGQAVAAGVRSTLAFDTTGRVTGNAACNRYGGGMQADGSSLQFTAMMSTKMACVEPAAMQQETRFLAALEAVRSFHLDGTKLVLLDENTKERVRLVPAGAATPPS